MASRRFPLNSILETNRAARHEARAARIAGSIDLPKPSAAAASREQQCPDGCAFAPIGAGASCPTPLGRFDLEAGVDQSPDDDFSRGLRIRDRRRNVVAVEQVSQHML